MPSRPRAWAVEGAADPAQAATAPPIHPAFYSAGPPILVVGMHRSGTSLVAGVLVQLGVFLGPDAQLPAGARAPDPNMVRAGYGETLPFRLVNDRVLARAGATWDRPDAYLAGAPAGADLMRAATFDELYHHFARFIPDGPWGWKDPRTTLTLRAWLEVFPEAQVIHVRRDPEAAARSLHSRALAWHAAAQAVRPPSPLRRAVRWVTQPAETLRRAAHRLGFADAAPGDAGVPSGLTGEGAPAVQAAAPGAVAEAPPDPRPTPLMDYRVVSEDGGPCTDLDYCRRLTEVYTRAALEARDSAAHWLEVDYEELTADPVRQVGRLLNCLELRPAPEQVRLATSLVRR